MYKIFDPIDYADQQISNEIFGLNFVATYDMEFLTAGPLLDLLGNLNPESLRYPGGSITEIMFGAVEYGDRNWAAAYFASEQDGVSQRDLLANFAVSAGYVDANIQLVLPTRIAFSETAGQALHSGNYGFRTEIHPEYFNLLENYIDEVVEQAFLNNTVVSRFEIGNEFWGAGKMTASEYGYLATEVTEFLAARYPEIDIVAQVSYNAGLYSPVQDTAVFLTENGDDFDVYFSFQDLTEIEHLKEYIMPGQGSGVGQTQDIGAAFANNPTALEALDGIVDHVYFRGGFDGIDNERDHALNTIPATFEEYSGSGAMPTYITEWSVRNIAGDKDSEGTNHLGLQYASSTLEAFFEFASNGVNGANFWPLTFGTESIDRRVLIDTSEQDYTFGGEIFRLLSENLIGFQPSFDFEVEGVIDVHGFTNSEQLIFYVSERSGTQNQSEIDFSDYASTDKSFVTITNLAETGDTGTDINSNPILTELGGQVNYNSTISLNQSAWSLAMIKVQSITEFDDTIHGSSAADKISGAGGGDFLFGFNGDDELSGNLGHDSLSGGAGNDLLKGGWGNDYISGGDGHDTIFVAQGSDFVEAGSGDDTITVSTSSDVWGEGFGAYNVSSAIQQGTGQFVSIEGFQQTSGVFNGGNGYDVLNLINLQSNALFLDDHFSSFHSDVLLINSTDGSLGVPRFSNIEGINGGSNSDMIDLTSGRYSLSNSDILINGGQGNDTIWGSDATEEIRGGDGSDNIFGGLGNDVLVGGGGSDIFEFNIFSDVDQIMDFNSSEGDKIHIYGSINSKYEIAFWDEETLNITFNQVGQEVTLSIHFDFQEEDNRASLMTTNISEFIFLV